jgi:hypothetical protein
VIPTELEQHIDQMFPKQTDYDLGRHAGIVWGESLERKRIIALIETYKEPCQHWQAIKYDWPADHDASCERCRPFVQLIFAIEADN